MKNFLIIVLNLVVLVPLGCSGGSSGNNSTGTTSTTVPAAPTGLTATSGNAQVVLSWTASPGAASYTVYYGTASGVTTASTDKAPGLTATSYTVTHLTNATPYFFIVTAINSAGESTASIQATATPTGSITTAPPAPEVLTATAGAAQVILKWATSSGATSYNLYYSQNTGVTPASGVKLPGIATTVFTHTGLTNGATYYYVVTAVNAGGESAASPQASATPLPPVISAPTALNATAGNAQVALSWTAATGVTSYNVYYGTSSSLSTSNGIRISSINGTSYTVTGLDNGTTYYFLVTAASTGGESAPSSTVSATPTNSPTPANLGLALLTDAQNTLQIIHLYDSNGNLLPTLTAMNIGFTAAKLNLLEQAGLTPDGSRGIVVGLDNVIRYFSGLQISTPMASTQVLDFGAYNNGGNSAVAMLPDGDEAVVSVGSNTQLIVVSGIRTGIPVIAAAIAIPSSRDGLAISNDGKVLLARGFSGLAVYSVSAIAPKAGNIAGTVSYAFSKVTDIPALGNDVLIGSGRKGMAISPVDSSRAVVVRAMQSASTIQVVTGLTSSSPAVGASVLMPGGAMPTSVAVSFDGKLAVVGTRTGLFLYRGIDTGLPVLVQSAYMPLYSSGTLTLVESVGITLDGKYVVVDDPVNHSLVVIPFAAGIFGQPVAAIRITSPGGDTLVVH